MTPEQKKAHLHFIDIVDRHLTKVKNAYWNEQVNVEDVKLRVNAIEQECEIFNNALNGGKSVEV